MSYTYIHKGSQRSAPLHTHGDGATETARPSFGKIGESQPIGNDRSFHRSDESSRSAQTGPATPPSESLRQERILTVCETETVWSPCVRFVEPIKVPIEMITGILTDPADIGEALRSRVAIAIKGCQQKSNAKHQGLLTEIQSAPTATQHTVPAESVRIPERNVRNNLTASPRCRIVIYIRNNEVIGRTAQER